MTKFLDTLSERSVQKTLPPIISAVFASATLSLFKLSGSSFILTTLKIRLKYWSTILVFD